MKEHVQQYSRCAGKITIFLLLIAVCITTPALALGVAGAKYMESMAPGSTGIHIISVSIGADEKPTDVQIDIMGFGQGTDRGYLALVPEKDTSPYSARTYISLDNSTLHLEPGTSKMVNAKINVPKNTGAGGRYAMIYVHTVPKPGESLATAVNIPVLITVSGTTPTESGSISQVDMGTVTLGQPITVTTNFMNTGNYHYYNTVNTVTLTDVKGNTISTVSTTPSSQAILPGSMVRFVANPPTGSLPIGTYTVVSSVSLQSGKILDTKTTSFEIQKPYIAPVTESTIILMPQSSGTLTSPDKRYSVTFPQGSVQGQVNITLKPHSRDTLPMAPQGVKFGATSFEIAGLSGLLSKDATVKITYSADDLAAAGGDTSKLKLAYYDTAQSGWGILPTTVNTQDTSLTATTNHAGVWAVMVSSSTPSGVPAPGASATKSPIPMTVILLSLIIAVIAVGKSVRK